MTVEEALAWCVEEMATVEFFPVYNVPRVRVKVGGHPYVERNSFAEAVNDAAQEVARRRAANSDL